MYIFPNEYHSTIVIIFIFNVQPTLLPGPGVGQRHYKDHKNNNDCLKVWLKITFKLQKMLQDQNNTSSPIDDK